MNKTFVKEYGLTLFLLALCLLFLLVVLGEWFVINKDYQKRMVAIDDTGSGQVVLEELSDENFSLPSMREFSEMIEHPLFIEGRMPVAEADDSEPILVPPGDLKMKYMGYIATPEGVLGMFLDETTKTYRKLEKGTVVEGWRVDELYPDRATLMQGGSKEELLLHKPKPKVASRTRPKSKSKLKNPFNRKQKPLERKKPAKRNAHDE